MFKGEKTLVFWFGLIILGLASIALFSISWYAIVTAQPYANLDYLWRILVPPVAGCIVFILIGLYMMRSGTKNNREAGKLQPLSQ